LVSHETLDALKPYSLRERVERLPNLVGFTLRANLLRTVYLRHQIHFRQVDLASVNKLRKADSLRREQLLFVERLRRLRADKECFFLDETSVHAWLTKRKTWSGLAQPVKLPLQAKRGKSWTILGALGGSAHKFLWTVADQTTTWNVLAFLRHFVREVGVPLHRVCLLTDNASAHHSLAVREFCAHQGLELVHLPAYSSALSPIERLWSQVKASWVRQMSQLAEPLDPATMKARVESVCREVAAATTPAIMRSTVRYEERVRNSQLV